MSYAPPVVYREYYATVLFFVVPEIKTIGGKVAFSCIVQANRVARESTLVCKLGSAWTGSTISGLFIVVPDGSRLVPHGSILELFNGFAAAGLPVRCGITHGSILCFEDVDGGCNFVGRAINFAARLAYSKLNAGCLVSADYRHFADALPRTPADALLDGAAPLQVPGKLHDGAGFDSFHIAPPALAIAASVNLAQIHSHDAQDSTAGLVIAYDLPRFSAGDESQLSKRVRGIVDSLKRVRQNHRGFGSSALYFCPGGDGGIIVLENAEREAYELSRGIAQSLVVESEYRADEIAVEARIGVHYGPVLLCRDVQERNRPAGLTCFIADDLASDAATTGATVVYSDALSPSIANGSDRFLDEHFVTLPLLASGPAAGIRRFAPRSANASKSPVIQELFGPLSSWQPAKSK